MFEDSRKEMMGEQVWRLVSWDHPSMYDIECGLNGSLINSDCRRKSRCGIVLHRKIDDFNAALMEAGS